MATGKSTYTWNNASKVYINNVYIIVIVFGNILYMKEIILIMIYNHNYVKSILEEENT